MKNIEAVIKKWEARSGPSSGVNYAAVNGGDQPGKKAWQDKFGDNLQAPQRLPSKFRQKRRKPKQTDFSFQPLTELKFHVPSAVVPAIYKRKRPVMGAACSQCCKESKALLEEIIPSWGMRNVLSMHMYQKKNLLKRSFCHIAFMWGCAINHHYPDVRKDVLQSARVRTYISTPAFQDATSADQDMKTAEKERRQRISALEKEASTILNRMAARVFKRFVHSLVPVQAAWKASHKYTDP